jgi:PAS domain S-box-containing protein
MSDEKDRIDVNVRSRERAEGSLLESDERFDIIVNGVTDYAIFMLDPAGYILSWNAGAERIKGYTAAEIIGQHFSRFYLPEDVATKWPDHELEVARREGRYEEENWRVRKDGSRFWANVVITAVTAEDGRLRGFLKLTRDLTERKQSVETLKESEERFRLLVESVKDYAIFMLDPEGRVASWNEGAHRIKGYTAAEIIGQHFSRFYPPEAVANRWPDHELEIARRDGRYEEEGWRVRKDGSLFWANVVITAVTDENGILRGFAKVTRDLTERRRVESLEEAGRRMNEFLAMVSHELRTPLTSMLGWIRLIRGKRLDAAVVERGLATIERNTLAQTRLIEDLLDVSRIISGKLRLTVEPADLEPSIRAAVDAVRLSAESKNVRLEVVLETDVGLVSADAERLQQVVWNLLSNAIKFTPKGGRVRIELARVNSSAEIRVIDTGKGIEPEFLPYVFDRFRQADPSITREQGGLGLGLAIVQYLVEAHGGTVRAESEGEGKGATFVVRLPLMAVNADRPKASAEAGSGLGVATYECPPELAGVRVLVVDDEADAREMLRVVLDGCQVVVRTAASAADATHLLDEWEADVLVSDIGLPGEDGYDLIRKIRQRPAERGGRIPAVALTAYARAEDRIRALSSGYQMHVTKPVEPAELIVVIKTLISLGARSSPPAAGDPGEPSRES